MLRLPRLPAELPPTYRWLLLGTLVAALATFVFPFLTLYLRQRGFSVATAGLVTGLFGAGSIVSGPVAGWCADRFGRRGTLVVALVACAVCTALLAIVRAPLAVGLAALALGLVQGAYRPAAGAVVADVVAPDHRARAYALFHWSNNLGIALSFAVGGALAHYGYPPLFVADAITTLLFAGVVFAKVPETRPATPHDTASSPAPGYRAVLADGHFMAMAGLLLVLLLPFCQFMVAVPVVMTAQGHSPAVFGRVMAVNGVLIALLQPTLSRRAARCDPGAMLALAATLVGLGMGGYAFARSAWGWAGATAIWSLGEILLFPVNEALVARLAPPALRGRYQGVLSVVFGLGMAAAPPLGGLVLQHLGATALWTGCLFIGLLVAAGQLAAAGPRRRRLAADTPGTRVRESSYAGKAG